MLTAIVSDLHLGVAREGIALAIDPAVRARLVEALTGADRVIVLGDLLELRERPLRDVLDCARPLVDDLGEALAGRELVIVPGNHDHQLAEPWLTRARLDGAPLGPEQLWAAAPGDGVAGRLAECMPCVEVSVAYPGFRPRPDVYATHGHYLDLRLTVPRLESIVVSLAGRVTGRGRGCSSVDDYEAVVAPLYALLYGIAQGADAGALARGGRFSRSVWRRTAGDHGGPAGRFLLGRVTIPGAVALLNRAGLGPFRPNISGPELRRSGLLAMGEVIESLGVAAEYVLFGHTHRPGPLPGDDRFEWTTPGGARLWNSGSWLHEPALLRPDRPSPYWPGTVIYLEDEGPPRIENALRGVQLPAAAR